MKKISRQPSLRRRIPELTTPSETSYWILIAKCAIPSSLCCIPQNVTLPPHYNVPHAIEAITAIIAMHFLEGTLIYPEPSEYTFCQETLNPHITISVQSAPDLSISIPLGTYNVNGIAPVYAFPNV
ncbi:MAG: hypothetical protein QRY72_00585 [Candidatus Rhabdochlamydia sp.]